MSLSLKSTLPDVAIVNKDSMQDNKINWVGMSGIKLPVKLNLEKQVYHSHATCQVYVNLDKNEAKGIHMSRLHKLLNSLNNISPKTLNNLIDDFLDSHRGLSNQAFFEAKLQISRKNKSLLTNNYGWQTYNSTIRVTKIQNQYNHEIGVDVTYSSTCPCSAALSHNLIMQKLQNKFAKEVLENQKIKVNDMINWFDSENGLVGVPHSQRSVAELSCKLDLEQLLSMDEYPLFAVINILEDNLKTRVQSIVKREDEQEFARLNADNLMFCEDAARILKHALDKVQYITDYWLRINHLESLHSHDAVAIIAKNIANGYQSNPNYSLTNPLKS